jgi:hypothetical protein
VSRAGSLSFQICRGFSDLQTALELPDGGRKDYIPGMTELLEQAIEAARSLPADMQDELARMLLQFAGKDQPVVELTAEEESSFAASLAQADRGEFAADEQLRAIWAKYGL